MKLFHSNTIEQFHIHEWLIERGLQPLACYKVEYIDANAVKITDRVGNAMTVSISDGNVHVEYHC